GCVAPALQSPLLGALQATPVLGHVLDVLPAPFVEGADYQATASRGFSSGFGTHASAHWAYYLVAIGTKTALPVLILAALGFAAARRAGTRYFALCAWLPGGLLLAYLS